MTPPTRAERAWQIYVAMIQGIYADSSNHDPLNFEFLAKEAIKAERTFMEELGK